MNALILFAALLSATLAGPKVPDQNKDVNEIKAIHSRLLSAFKARNADVIKSLFAKDFKQTANGMTFNRDAAVAQMTQGSASAKVDWSISGIQVTGDKATYTSNFKFESTSVENSGAPGQKGKNHTISGTGVQRVQLSKLAGKWLYTNLDVVSSKIMMDGKPFNPQAQQASANKSAQ